MRISKRLSELGLQLPEVPRPRGAYVPVVVHANIAYVSGQVSREGEATIRGPATSTTAPEIVIKAAHACVLRALSALDQAVVGGLDAVDRILFVRGFVHAEAGFQEHPRILDEVSLMLISIFGERGRHARSAVGVAGLPSGGLLEIELTAAITESETVLGARL